MCVVCFSPRMSTKSKMMMITHKVSSLVVVHVAWDQLQITFIQSIASRCTAFILRPYVCLFTIGYFCNRFHSFSAQLFVEIQNYF